MLNTFLFDLDGTLFDSADANIAAYSAAFKVVGVPFNTEAYRSSFGYRFDDMMNILAPTSTLSQRKKIKILKSNFYKKNLGKVLINEPLFSLIEVLRSKHHKIGLVTTASRTNVMNLLEYFHIDTELFDLILCGEDVNKAKPDPECYVTAMSKLGVNPSECCIFEDSEVGVLAANGSGASCIRIKM